MSKLVYLFMVALFSVIAFSSISLATNETTTTTPAPFCYMNNLVVLWHLDEGTGTFAIDSSGNGYDATLFHSAFFNATDGKFGSSLQLPDDTGYLQSNSNVGIGTAFTVSTWVNPDIDIQGSYSRIIENDYGSSFYLGTDSTGTQYQFIVNGNVNDLGSIIGGAVSSGTWVLLTATFDGSMARFYIDGVEITNATLTPPFPVSIPIYIAKGESGFVGKIDETMIFNRALNNAEIQNLHDFNCLNQIPLPNFNTTCSIVDIQAPTYCLDETTEAKNYTFNGLPCFETRFCAYGCDSVTQGCNINPFYAKLAGIILVIVLLALAGYFIKGRSKGRRH